ncbi:pimeloyl-ACP methyl ester carboxylesterase [Antricoccus suffuscus]|uniref:Pimeloyl-ACP methyl ester carboxylesterase n=1 Tax=Antricoccus suffuscus TaxID=1629062 RepID=A0A2T0ZWW7_9ACTN|nr:alpha/beta hydrolase [Antricoccus suffuscus]PRZ40747.1 pimeloyl-ACP methyl ester carboxylesterase [Antricoccus suffuscus]
MRNAITEHTLKTARHTTGYLQAGPEEGPLLIFCHGWPELSRSWRHQLPTLAALGFRCIAPDMRGYGRSSVYGEHSDYRQELIVADMLELVESTGRDTAVWIGHDWGSPVVWNVAAHHPEVVAGIVSLCVPYLPQGFTLDGLVDYVDRTIYPEDKYPAGQWDYQYFYEESFESASEAFDADVAGVVKALFRRGRADQVGAPAPTATTRRDGGWFRGGPVPDIPQDFDVITEQDLAAYTAALQRNGFFGPDSWYMNHSANGDYSKKAKHGGRLEMPVLFLHGRYDQTCETVNSTLADPMRGACPNLTEAIVDSGHWMAQEQPVAVNAAVAKWLATELSSMWPAPSDPAQ